METKDLLQIMDEGLGKLEAMDKQLKFLLTELKDYTQTLRYCAEKFMESEGDNKYLMNLIVEHKTHGVG